VYNRAARNCLQRCGFFAKTWWQVWSWLLWQTSNTHHLTIITITITTPSP
jgi:MFS-type transporter involved in bile tolerance (Atg22 family)